MHVKKHHTQEHIFYSVAGITLIVLSILIACYYYVNNPTYRTNTIETEPGVRGISTDNHAEQGVDMSGNTTLTIRIPDGLYIELNDQEGRKSGYVNNTNGYLNEIPHSEVILGSDGSKSIVVTNASASKYRLTIRGIARQEAVSIEVEDGVSGVQSELISVKNLKNEGAEYTLGLSPLMIESLSDDRNE